MNLLVEASTRFDKFINLNGLLVSTKEFKIIKFSSLNVAETPTTYFILVSTSGMKRSVVNFSPSS